MQNSVNSCVTIGFVENLTVKTARIHILFDVNKVLIALPIEQ